MGSLKPNKARVSWDQIVIAFTAALSSACRQNSKPRSLDGTRRIGQGVTERLPPIVGNSQAVWHWEHVMKPDGVARGDTYISTPSA